MSNDEKGKNQKKIDLNDWEDLGNEKIKSIDLDLDYEVEDTFEELKIDENDIDNKIKKITK